MQTVSILPIDLLPELFGLRWGLTPTQCQATLGKPPAQQCPDCAPLLLWQAYDLPIQGQTAEVTLCFDEDGLGCINVTRQSRDFWEYVEEDPVEAIRTEFIADYHDAVAAMTAVIGPPDFQRTESVDDELDDDMENEASYLRWWAAGSPSMQTYWNGPKYRLQIEFDHQDQELPFIVACAAMRPD